MHLRHCDDYCLLLRSELFKQSECDELVELDYPWVTRICTLTALVCTSQVFISKSITAMEVRAFLCFSTPLAQQLGYYLWELAKSLSYF